MKKYLYIFFILFSFNVYSQETGIPLYQLEYAPDTNYVIGSKVNGEAIWISASLLSQKDSIFLRNDTIFLKNGSGFVKMTSGGVNLKAGQTTTVQTAIINDTIYAEVNNNSIDSVKIKNNSVNINDLAFDPYQDLYPHSTGFVLSHPTLPLQDTVIFTYTGGVITTPPSGCNCSIADIPTLSDQLASKSDTSHQHPISKIINLQNSLDNKSNLGHAHIISDVTGLQTALDSKANTTHAHAIGDVTGLQTALDGKENSFAKGSLVQGTNVTLSGTLTNRLVGSGDITINATGGGSSVTVQENINTAPPSLTASMQSICALTLNAGTYLLNANLSGLVLSGTISAQLFNFTNSSILARAESSSTVTTLSLVKTITLTGTATIQLRAAGSSNILYSSSQGTQILTALKIN